MQVEPGYHGAMCEDLGCGVYVSPAGNGELVVTSHRLDPGARRHVAR